jgi:polyisoprenoid-binding protein YceI
MNGISIITLLLVFLSSSTFAKWELQESESAVSFVSIKKSAIGEVHSFSKVNGSISDAGEVKVAIDLSSVETNIPVRNERMQTMLFETAKFLEANISASVNMEKIAAFNEGDTYVESVTFVLSLHGFSHEVTNKVQVTKLTGSKLLVSSLTPFIINADNFGLKAGIEKLRVVAKLPSISTAVPVSYSLIFKQSEI